MSGYVLGANSQMPASPASHASCISRSVEGTSRASLAVLLGTGRGSRSRRGPRDVGPGLIRDIRVVSQAGTRTGPENKLERGTGRLGRADRGTSSLCFGTEAGMSRLASLPGLAAGGYERALFRLAWAGRARRAGRSAPGWARSEREENPGEEHQ